MKKIKRKQLKQNYENGGLNMVDIKTQLQTFQIKWINRLISHDDMNWKIISKTYFDKYGKIFTLFKMNFGCDRNLKCVRLPLFYKNLLKAWVNAGGGCMEKPKSFASIRKQVIWGNQFIKCKINFLLFKNWIDDDIIYINDIISPAGEIDSTFILEELRGRQNWISEIHKLKLAIPEKPENMLESSASKHTSVQTETCLFLNDHKNKHKIFQTRRINPK